jgi:hypothetical protein
MEIKAINALSCEEAAKYYDKDARIRKYFEDGGCGEKTTKNKIIWKKGTETLYSITVRDGKEIKKDFSDIEVKLTIIRSCDEAKILKESFPGLANVYEKECVKTLPMSQSGVTNSGAIISSGNTASGTTNTGSTASGSTASIETCDVTEYKFSNNSKPYLSKNLKYVMLSTKFSYKFKKNECKGKEKIVDTIKFTGCPKNLWELDQSVKNYVEMK